MGGTHSWTQGSTSVRELLDIFPLKLTSRGDSNWIAFRGGSGGALLCGHGLNKGLNPCEMITKESDVLYALFGQVDRIPNSIQT